VTVLLVDNLEKSFGIDTLFEKVSFTLGWGQKLGLVGRNGAGKTTLLRMLTGEMEPDRGTVRFVAGVRPGYLKQEDVVDPARTVIEETEEAFAWVRRMEARLAELSHRIADAAHAGHAELESAAMDEYGGLRERFEIMGGYDQLRDIPGVLKRLGFSESDQEKACGSLSGGEKTRLAIARLLLSGPDILLLDEPTNHLDIEATEWLESFLRAFGGALVLVSHDRLFLDRVVTSVAEIEHQRLTIYNGNVSSFLRQKAEREERQAELHAREQAEVERLMTFFEKWKNTPTKKNQAWSRFKWAERIKANMTEAPLSAQKSAKMSLKSALASGREALVIERLKKAYGERVLFESLTVTIERGERIGVVGPNGAGKSTLIKVIVGREDANFGIVRLGHNVTTGYFAQDVADLDLDRSVLENMLDMGGMTAEEARTFLGRFLFTGDDVFRPVSSLSGGEKNKLSLAQITYMRPNLLILDEPTNHLDLESREALGKMLQGYDGALILVSHDRYLLDQVTQRTIEVKDGQATVYDVPYGEYRQLSSRAQPRDHAASPTRLGQSSSRAQSRDHVVSCSDAAEAVLLRLEAMNFRELSKERTRAKARLDAAETAVDALESELDEIVAGLSRPSDQAVELAKRHGEVQLNLEQAITAWEQAQEYLDLVMGV
jgi:ATP-binding cassette subfamily F protein 3